MAKKKKNGEEEMLGTKEIAKNLNIKPGLLRRVLRSQKKGNDGEYTRYRWKKGDPFLAKIPKLVDEYKEGRERDSKAKAKSKAPKKAKAKAKPKAKSNNEQESAIEEVA